MGILIKAPTRRREPTVTQVDSQGNTSDMRGALHIREVVRITDCAANNCTCGNADTVFLRRCAMHSATACIRRTRSPG